MTSRRYYQDKQTSFAGGRFSPELRGRTDLAKYTSAFKDSKNFFVSPEGTLLNRAGTETVDKVVNNNPSGDACKPARLIPFVFSDDDVIIIAFGGNSDGSAGYGFLRFYKYDRTTDTITLLDAEVQRWSIITGGEDGDPLEYEWSSNNKTFPWSRSQADDFRFVQSGDVIYITYENAADDVSAVTGEREPFKLVRMTSDSLVWRYQLLDVTPYEFPDYGGTPRLLEQADWDAAVNPSGQGITPSLPLEDSDHPARPWQWAVSRLMRTSEGVVYETKPFIITHSVQYLVDAWREDRLYGGSSALYSYVYWDKPEDDFIDPAIRTFFRDNFFMASNDGVAISSVPAGQPPTYPDGGPNWYPIDGDGSPGLDPVLSTARLPNTLVCYADRPMIIDWRTWTQLPETIASDADAIVGTRVYKGRDGHFGYIGETDADAHDFIDDGIEPDFLTPPRTVDNHLRIPSAFPLGHPSYTAPVQEWPSALGMYEGRFIMAATQLRPGLVVGSAVDQYNNFDNVSPAKDSDPYAFELASRKWEKVRFIVGRHGMYIFTSEGEWVAAGSGQYEILTPNSVAIRQVSEFGSSKLQPLVIGENVIFVENTGCEPRAFYMQGMQSKSVDMVSYSRAFFRGRQVVAWCWTEVPWQTIWLVMDDGKMLSCCWHPDQQMVAWAEHEIQGGTPVSIISIPADKEHAAVLLVKRGDDYYLERMRSRTLTDVRDSRFLDAHVFYDGRNTSTNEAWVSSIASARDVGDTVNLYFTSGTEAVEGETNNLVVRVYGTKTTVTGTDEYGNNVSTTETVFCEVLLYSAEDPDHYLGELLTPLEEDMDGVHTTTWEICRESIQGLDHLEGQTVMALADGNVIEQLTVQGGRVMLAQVAGSNAPPLTGRWGTWAAVVCVGLQYDCDFESLSVVAEKGRPRVVQSVLVETYGSRGGFVGQSLDDEDNLEEVVTREVSHEYGTIPLKVEETPTAIRAAYDIKGTIAFRQSKPLPISVISIIREMEFGDR